MSPSRRRRASPEWEGREIITVAALPGRGLYVRHLGHPEGVDGVHRPTVPPPGASSRPPAGFEPRWVGSHVHDFDVVHVHAVPPQLPAADVAAAVAAVQAAGKPLVVTAYHLSDPSGNDPDGFADQLDRLIPAADAVITLTASAAEEISSRWDRQAVVVPHPHVADFVMMRRERPVIRPGTFEVGAHLGSLRMPADPVRLVEALAVAIGALPDARLTVTLHEYLLDSEATRYSPTMVHEIRSILDRTGGRLRLHRPMTDSQLWDYLFALDGSVLPPLHGSHSIWPEACHDLGTPMAAPAGSHAAGQRPCVSYRTEPDGTPEVASLQEALTAARTTGASWRADPSDRWKERVRIAEILRGLYEGLLGRSR